MAEPLTDEQTAEIKKLWHTACSTREAERKTGICKSLIAETWEKQAKALLKGTDDEELPKFERPTFRRVADYTCPVCEKIVNIEPCVACTARRYKEAREART